MLFKDIPGHHSIKQKLIAAASREKVAQALMFLGPEGNGSLPLALAFSTYLNCTNRGAVDACGQCGACIKSLKYIHPDIHYTYPVVTKKQGKPPLSVDYIEEWRQALKEMPYMNAFQWLRFINAENKQGNITVDECKDIIRNQSLKAYEASFKVQIIWMAELLKTAGNVLLKIIEEPPPRTVFILIVQQQEQLLNTILSRTQVVKVSTFLSHEIESTLTGMHGVGPDEARRISRLAEGNMNAALQLLQGEDGVQDALLLRWLRAILSFSNVRDWETVVELSNLKDEIAGIGRENQKIFLRYVLFFLRETLMIAMAQPTKLTDEEQKLANEFASGLSIDQIDRIARIIDQMHYYIERNANPRILFFNNSLKIARIMKNKKLEPAVGPVI